MPVVKATESLGTRPVVMVLYGDPGICKTSLANTCESPILLDFDRGVQRSFGRKDTLVLDTWDEVLNEEQAGTFKNYKTVAIDTAKAALDDFLMVYVIKQDYKMATNKLKAYGEIGDKFKLFVNNRRAEGVDIVIIAHAKKDEDTKRHIPDVTGQSAQLLMRIADQVGYITMENNQRVISFDPTDLTVGKNVAGLPKLIIPAKGTPEFKSYGADLIQKVKTAIDDMNEEQREALDKSARYQDELANVSTPDGLTELLGVVNELPDYLKLPLRKAIGAKATEKGWTANPVTKKFEAAQGTGTPDPAAPAAAGSNGATGHTPATSMADIQPIAEKTQQEKDKELFDTISAVTQLGDLASLYQQYAVEISTNSDLQRGYEAKKAELINAGQKEEKPKRPYNRKNAPAPAPADAAPAAESAPAALEPAAPPVATTQPIEWFNERVGKEVWMQGAEGRDDHFTGVYFIEAQEYPEYMLNTLQPDGYTFRDLTPEEANAAKEEVTA